MSRLIIGSESRGESVSGSNPSEKPGPHPTGSGSKLMIRTSQYLFLDNVFFRLTKNVLIILHCMKSGQFEEILGPDPRRRNDRNSIREFLKKNQLRIQEKDPDPDPQLCFAQSCTDSISINYFPSLWSLSHGDLRKRQLWIY